MAAYAATGHITSARPQRAQARVDHARPIEPLSPDDAPVAEEIAGQSFDDRLSDRIDAVKHGWSQTIFFLLDPESWR